jgi:hypothetical protein
MFRRPKVIIRELMILTSCLYVGVHYKKNLVSGAVGLETARAVMALLDVDAFRSDADAADLKASKSRSALTVLDVPRPTAPPTRFFL